MKQLVLLTLFVSGFVSIAQNDCNAEETHTGEGTYYDFEQAGGFGNCSFDDTKIRPFLIGAMNETDYANADYCGACVEIEGPQGRVKVQIIDRCPECQPGDIDLSPEAFDDLAPRIDGRIPISWKVVPCVVTGPVVLYYKEGSNQWWTAVQVRNHRNQIAKLEFWNGAAYVELPRQRYNYFLKNDGMGVGPHTFRITDVYGNSIVEEDIPFILTTDIEGINQFPECVITGTESGVASEIKVVQSGDELRFENKEGSYQLMNFQGVEIKTGKTSENCKLDVSSGSYLFKIVSGTNMQILRVFVP